MVKKSLLWIYRAALITLWLIIIVLAISVLAMRYAILPHIKDYKEQIAQRASLAAGQKISIGDIEASWDGLNPHFSLLNVELYDAQSRPALSLDHIETSLSWLSIPLMEPRLSAITIHNPDLTIRREADGTIYVAGISMSGAARPEFPNWLLRQGRIDIVDATVLWQDDLRKAPPLTLNKLNLQILNPAWGSLIGHHRFGLHATPSAGSSEPIDLRGNVYGRDVSQPSEWHGTVYGHLEGTDIAAWRNWVNYPFDLREGFGAAQFWLDFSKGEPVHVTSDVILANVKTRLAKNSPEATLNSLSGRLKWSQFSDGQEIRAEHIKIVAPGGLDMQNGSLGIRERLLAGKTWVEGDIQLDEIQLEALNTFAAYLPLPEETAQRLTDTAAVGKLERLELRWKGEQADSGRYILPSTYSIRGRFIGLGMQAYRQIPGFSNFSGSIDADETKGMLTVNTLQAMLDFKQTMRWPIPVDKLTGIVKWQNSHNKTDIRVSNLSIANTHLAGTLNGSYLLNGVKGGFIDMNAKFSRVDAKFLHYYYPNVIGKDTLHWLDTSILAGNLEDVNAFIKGNLDDFPYADGKSGLFKATAKLTGGELDYGIGWPKIENLALTMLFQGKRMELNATGGNLLGNQIARCKAVVPVLDAAHPVLDLVSDGTGTVSDGVKYINSSPIREITEGFTDDLQTTGNGKLSLELHIPLDNTDATKVKGSYTIINGSMASKNIPEFTRINGKIDFNETALRAQNVNTWLYGGPAILNLTTGKDHLIRIAARGRATDAGLKQAFGPGLADRVSGSSDWYTDLTVQNQMVEIAIRSNLLGMASNLPAPLSKSANERMLFHVEKKQQIAQQDTINISFGNLLGAKLLRTEQNGNLKLERGEIGLNVQPQLPTQPGLAVRGVLEKLDLDEWRNLFDKSTGSNSDSELNISKVDLTVNVLDIFDRRINALKLNVKPVSDGWQVSLQSREITGDAQWSKQGAGKITARLKNLLVPSATPGTAELRTQGDFKQQAEAYPALDISADNFEIGQKRLGKLELQANEHDGDWSIEKLRISNADSVLNSEGEWHNWKRRPNTRMTFNWEIADLGRTLERFGYADTVKGAGASITGQLKWQGSPHEFDIPGLDGNLQLEAHHGQILKLKPGVGRFFSVLSLQNLPRRLTFDFRDVFGSGFAFDKIAANVRIDRGIMRSDDFKMEGPTASVEMKGETDLQKETQHLFIHVTPFISESLSIAALAGGPIAGAAAFVAQKIFKDSINNLAADDYEIVGTWNAPQELKSGNSDKPAAPTSTPFNNQ